jgi:hypothetical protein
MWPTLCAAETGKAEKMSNRSLPENPSWCLYPYLGESAEIMFDELAWWVHALKAGREEAAGSVGVVR